MLKTTKVSLTDFGKVNLVEISQQVPILYSFLTKDNKQCHPLVQCKDFLHDVVYSVFSGKKTEIYGFSYTSKNPVINTNQISLLIVFNDDISKENMENHCKSSLDFLHYYENVGEFLGRSTVSIAEIYDIKGKKSNCKGVVFNGPKEWLSVPALISLYTMLIRLGSKNLFFSDKVQLKTVVKNFIDKWKTPDNDRGYLKKIFPYLETILKYRKTIFELDENGFYEEYSKNELSTSIIHNSRGILALCYGGYPMQIHNQVKNYYQKEVSC